MTKQWWLRALMLAGALVVTGGLLGGCGGSSSTHSGIDHSSASGATSPSSQHPNIVFVLTDDLSSDLVPYMPHVQQLSRQGMTFTHYVVTDSLCCPSRSSIFSGKFPHDTGVYTNGVPDGGFDVFHARGEERSTFATALQAAGYRTGMMGKYLNGYDPTTRYVPPGWSEWDVAGQGYKEFNYDLNVDGHVVHHGDQPSDYLTDVVAGRGVGFIDASAAAHKPFMLEIATFAPHKPYTPAPRDASRFPGLKAPRGPAFDRQNVDPPSWLGQRPPLKPKQLRRINKAFRKRVQSVQSVDAMIGRLEATLAARGLSKDTYIVFSSDNGLHLGQHRLRAGKQTAFDTDIRVPLVVVGPGVPAGRQVDALTENIDLCPTFTQLGGAKIPSGVDGHSLVTLLQGGQAAGWRQAALVEHHGPDLDNKDPDHQSKASGNPTTYAAIRTANSVYVEYRNGQREYYDIAKDPNEIVNTVGSLSASVRSSLHAKLVALQHCHGERACWKAGGGSS